jgi:hypothetical protein
MIYIGCSEDEASPRPLPSDPINVDYSGAYLGTRYVNYYSTRTNALLDSSNFVDTIFVFKHKINSDSFFTWGYSDEYQQSVNWGRLNSDGTFRSSGSWYDSNLNDSLTQQHNHRISNDTFYEVIETFRTNFRWYGEGVFIKME